MVHARAGHLNTATDGDSEMGLELWGWSDKLREVEEEKNTVARLNLSIQWSRTFKKTLYWKVDKIIFLSLLWQLLLHDPSPE